MGLAIQTGKTAAPTHLALQAVREARIGAGCSARAERREKRSELHLPDLRILRQKCSDCVRVLLDRIDYG